MSASHESNAPRRAEYRFDGVWFDARTGELRRGDGAGKRVVRLAPQPAKLLQHLIDRRPQVVATEEVRALLWPDVQVEFEQGLHTCVRKVRAALGDSATAPRYIETISRRGYRFLVDVEASVETSPVMKLPVDVEAAAAGPVAVAPDLSVGSSIPFTEVRTESGAEFGAEFRDASSGIDRGRAGARANPPTRDGSGKRKQWIRAVALVSLVALMGLIWLVLDSRDGRSGAVEPFRIAVMPFEPTVTHSVLTTDNDLAESIVDALVGVQDSDGARRYDVVGPTTTHPFLLADHSLPQLIDEFAIDYVVNGRETRRDGVSGLLVEIIRGRDGAHVWTRYLRELPSGEQATSTVADVVVALRAKLAAGHAKNRGPR